MATPWQRALRKAASFAALVTLTFAASAVMAAKPLLLPHNGVKADPLAAGIKSGASAVKFNKNELLAMAVREEAEFTLPNAKKHAYVLDLVQSHGDGIYTWIGSHKQRGTEYRAIITTGPSGSYAVFSTPDGEFRLVPGAGHDWLVDMSAESAFIPNTALSGGHDKPVPAAKAKKSETFGQPEAMAAVPGVNALFVPKATPTPQYVVDLMIVYSRGYANKLGGNLMTRLHFLVARANTAFADSEVAITMRLVNATMVDYDDAMADTTALEQISPAYPSFNASVFGGIEGIRTQFGADMVTFLRDGANFGGNGAGWVSTATPDANYMYSVNSGCIVGCEWIFIHQLGHNMGNKHSRPDTAVEAGGTATYPEGAFPYSYGHYYCASGALTCNTSLPNNTAGGCTAMPQCSTQDPANFATIMALFQGSAEKIYRFSNAAQTCSSSAGPAQPCGIASGSTSANDSAGMNAVRALVSGLKSTVVPAGQPGSLQFTASTFAALETGGSMALTVSRIGGSTGAISVAYATSNGTAVAGQDYTASTGTLTWADGDAASKTITIPVTSDAVTEGNETFKVTLSSPTGATGVYLGHPASAVANILSPFPATSSMPAGFTTPGTSNGAWTVETDQAYEGTYSLRSAQGITGDNTFSTQLNSDISYTAAFSAGTVSFAYRVSSFQNAGNFQFLVDGTVVFTATGETGWKLFSHELSAGNHTLTWRFANTMPTACSSPTWNPPAEGGAACADRTWIDAIALPPASSLVAKPADFNGDGKPDLLWSNTPNGNTYAWFMNGITLASDQFVGSIDPSWKLVGTGDFNGDGHNDVVWRNEANGNAFVWYLVNGVFQSDAFLFSIDPVWKIAGVNDFNADGKPDLLMANATSGLAFMWYYNNTTPIGDHFLYQIDTSWKVEQTGDFNGDGQPDLLFRNVNSGLAFVWYTQYSGGTTTLAGSTSSIFSIDASWEVVGFADWNNDGTLDFVFRNTGSGTVFVWYTTGGALAGSDFIVQIDPSWEIRPRY